jgi:hypothetical protein
MVTTIEPSKSPYLPSNSTYLPSDAPYLPSNQESMRSRQISERLGVEEAHMMEFQHFTMMWDRKVSEYEVHAQDLLEVRTCVVWCCLV